jgi:hypothetical protein
MSKGWSFEHAVECAVSAEFAWRFWTNVENWALDADIDSVELDGPFAAGAQGMTRSKSSGRIPWRVAECDGMKAVVEFEAPGAIGRFAWSFEDVAGRARITQRASLEGERATEYAETIGRALEAGIPQGMAKLCEAMQSKSREDMR